jgi:hypothetical protein
VNDFLKSKVGKRKLSLKQENNGKLFQQSYDQGQQFESELLDNNLIKLSEGKISEDSALFDLSHSLNSKQMQKRSKNATSEIYTDNISSLKDFSNLCSSKAGSAAQNFINRIEKKKAMDEFYLKPQNNSEKIDLNSFGFGSFGKTYD